MLTFYDYSNRRGTVVPLLDKIHAMFAESAAKDKSLPPPEHIISWRQKMRKNLLDINRRFLIAMDGAAVAGVFFYRYEGTDVYIEDLQIAWTHRYNPQVIDGLLKKLEYDSSTQDANFFAGERVKAEVDKEMLAAVGFKQEHAGGFEPLGGLGSASAALKIRYTRATHV